MTNHKSLWKDEYSVGVVEIDDQHKKIFLITDKIIGLLNTGVTKELLNEVLDSLVEYKRVHLATEEKYFKEFNYEDAEEHILSHKDFDIKLTALKEKDMDDPIKFAFELVEFVENWLIMHIMYQDKKYMKCFAEHGLK